ncbi:DUF4350 domain-containing protein [Microbacterium lacusdiani]
MTAVDRTAGADPFAAEIGERRTRARSALGWVLIGVAVVLIGAVVTLLSSDGWREREPLDPEGAGPDGARAIVSILREQGVEVVEADRRGQALAALETPGTTLVITDPWYLSDDTILALADAADDTVVLDPSAETAALLAPGAEHSGFGDGPVEPACALPAAERAGAILPGRGFTAPSGVTGCYPVGDGHALLRSERPSPVTLIDGTELFDNAHLAAEGNAALGLGLIGTHDRVVWFVPSLADADDGEAAPQLGDLVPPWLTPAIVLLLVAGLAAAVWRGRRFGPLVAERLPVTVRGSETLEGRARLYARAADPAHAAALLRDGATGRMARRLGLSASASRGEVADAAAARVGGRADVIRAILEASPATDADLAEFGTRLRDLEDAVEAAVRSTSGRSAR